MDQLKSLFEGKIDYQGQRLADRICQEVIIMGALLAFLLGFAFDKLSVMMYSFAAISFIAFVAVVPAWPFYNRHETKWLPNLPEESSVSAEATQDTKT